MDSILQEFLEQALGNAIEAGDLPSRTRAPAHTHTHTHAGSGATGGQGHSDAEDDKGNDSKKHHNRKCNDGAEDKQHRSLEPHVYDRIQVRKTKKLGKRMYGDYSCSSFLTSMYKYKYKDRKKTTKGKRKGTEKGKGSTERKSDTKIIADAQASLSTSIITTADSSSSAAPPPLPTPPPSSTAPSSTSLSAVAPPGSPPNAKPKAGSEGKGSAQAVAPSWSEIIVRHGRSLPLYDQLAALMEVNTDNGYINFRFRDLLKRLVKGGVHVAATKKFGHNGNDGTSRGGDSGRRNRKQKDDGKAASGRIDSAGGGESSARHMNTGGCDHIKNCVDEATRKRDRIDDESEQKEYTQRRQLQHQRQSDSCLNSSNTDNDKTDSESNSNGTTKGSAIGCGGDEGKDDYITSVSRVYDCGFRSIGRFESCFKEKHGTPRQGQASLTTLGRLRLHKYVSPDAVSGLSEFSHVWIIFIFHANKQLQQSSSSSSSSSSLLSPTPSPSSFVQHHNVFTKAKIKPPRLKGRKMGVYATRTPHRYNPIGLTVARLETIEEGGKSLLFSGIDLIQGTPILDIKPYHPADSIPLPRDLALTYWDRSVWSTNDMGGTAGADKGRGGDHRDNGDDGDDGADGEQGDGDTNDDANARTTVVNDVNTESKIPSPSPTSPTPSAVSASASKDPPSPYLRVPDWLSTLPPTTLKVRFSVKAEQQLRSCLPHLQLYDRSNTAQIRKAIVHCLELDPRTIHSRNKHKHGVYGIQFDRLNICFHMVYVKSAAAAPTAEVFFIELNSNVSSAASAPAASSSSSGLRLRTKEWHTEMLIELESQGLTV